jgi:dimethylargininase
MFTNAIVRTPGKSIANGITTAQLGIPDYKLALDQHSEYINILQQCGLITTVLEPIEEFPDSVFVEDVALLTSEVAIITNPGATSRNGETKHIEPVLHNFYQNIKTIKAPGNVEAGDIMMVGNHFYIGISERTNKQGAQQLITILKQFGLTGSTVELTKMLHLKTGISYLENNNLLACGEFIHKPEFQSFNIIKIPDNESYAANSIYINNRVLIPKGFPESKLIIEKIGYVTYEVDISEFQKLDGGLSCLSLRF